MYQTWSHAVVAALLVRSVALGDFDSTGPNGIDSRGLTLSNGSPLNGMDVNIGQV